ncbi:MAG: HGGxSTG domain-containing protein [Methylobacter sp.]|nr:HGGxSTG domain-containing protein [Methylobacter sp.]
MSTHDQRKRLKEHSRRRDAAFDEWAERGYQDPPPKFEPIEADLIGLACGAKTRAGTPCKLTSIYTNGRCKWHGGCSTGPSTSEGKKRSVLNGFCPKNKRTHTG